MVEAKSNLYIFSQCFEKSIIRGKKIKKKKRIKRTNNHINKNQMQK